MSGSNHCSPSPCLRYGRRHLSDALFLPIYHLESKIITLARKLILSKLPKARREKRERSARQPDLMLAGGREERQSNPDWHRDEDPILFEERVPVGATHKMVSKDHRVWEITSGARLMID